jgi:hypothetical protein
VGQFDFSVEENEELVSEERDSVNKEVDNLLHKID